MSVSISNAASSGGSVSGYYEQQKENYYSADKTIGVWHGKGLDGLGLKDGGQVNNKELDNLCKGFSKDGVNAITYNAGRENRRDAYDITFSPDKSVSITAAFSDKETETAIKDAHNEAVKAAMDYIEKNLSQYRETKGQDTQKVNSGNLVYATYDHSLSRENDPQIHTHAVVLNLTQTKDSSYKAIENRDIFKAQKLAESIYQSALAKGLSDRNINVEQGRYGQTKISGVSDNAITLFSKRAEKITEKQAELKENTKYSKEAVYNTAKLSTRPDKDLSKNFENQKEAWAKEAKDAGIDIKADLEKGQASGQVRLMTAEQAVAAAINDLTSKQAVVSKNELLSTSLKYAFISNIDRIEKAISDNKDIVKLKDRETGKIAYSTVSMVNTEKAVKDNFETGVNKREQTANKELIDTKLNAFENKNNFKLSDEQRGAIHTVLESKDTFSNIQGVAGAGKTTLLQALKTVTDAQGNRLIAISYQGKAADEMAKALKDNKVQSATIESFKSSGVKLTNKDIVIMDEASMTGAKDMLEIQNKIKESGAKMVMIGDYKQIQAIAAGKAFEQAVKSGFITKAELNESLRQRNNKEYQNTVSMFAKGDTDGAFKSMGDKLQEITNKDDRRQAVLNEYAKSGKNTVIVTNTNAEKDYYNKNIRDGKIEKGEIKNQREITVSNEKKLNDTEKRQAHNYEIGDRLYLKENAIGLGKKGAEFTVKAIDKENNKLILENISKTEWQGHNTGKFIRQGVSNPKNLAKLHNKNERQEFRQERLENTVITEQKNIKNDTLKMFGFRDTKTTVEKTVKTEHVLDLYDKDLVNKIGGISKDEIKAFGQGDKIMFTKNDNKFKVKNGQTAEIIGLEKDKMTVKMESGDIKKIDTNKYKSFDYAYAITINKSQGMTTDKVIADLNAKYATFNSSYVANTRGKEDYKIFTDDKEMLKENSSVMQEKTSTLDYDIIKDDGRDTENERNINDGFERDYGRDDDNDKER
jgi:conjugative relaxase-like TrwC/TraI family protein